MQNNQEPNITLPDYPPNCVWEYRGMGWDNANQPTDYCAYRDNETLIRGQYFKSTPGGVSDLHYWESVNTPTTKFKVGDTVRNRITGKEYTIADLVSTVTARVEDEYRQLWSAYINDLELVAVASPDKTCTECDDWKDTVDLIYDIMTDEVNVIDECEKWLRVYAPEKLREAYVKPQPKEDFAEQAKEMLCILTHHARNNPHASNFVDLIIKAAKQ